MSNILVTPAGAAPAEGVPTKTLPSETRSIEYYGLDTVDPVMHAKMVNTAVKAACDIVSRNATDGNAAMVALLNSKPIRDMLIGVSRLPVFSNEMAEVFKNNLAVLGTLKQIKYFHALPKSALAILIARLAEAVMGDDDTRRIFKAFVDSVVAAARHTCRLGQLIDDAELSEVAASEYIANASYLESADPHAVYPTSTYRQCNGLTHATADASTIEAVMSTSITTTIRIQHGVLDPANRLLHDVYKPLGRAVAVIDDKVEKFFGAELSAYFDANGIQLKKMVYSGNEVAKDIDNVEQILIDLKKTGVARHEPVLIVGGGVIADIGGFACALYHRNTPYVMLCTSIVSGIDAGPSPRTCCDGYGYKNLYGAYHPPVLTLTDRAFFRTLHPGWLRHGIAEIIKMSCVKDYSLFCLLEECGPRLVTTKFGIEGDTDDEFSRKCDLIIAKAMEGYVRSEYGNLWETHQCRPHAFGHTWSPGYELPAGMLHGHAVGTCMGYGSYLSFVEGWITKDELSRVLGLISNVELTLWHPIMEDVDLIYAAQQKIVDKRGGNLCAPVPKELGKCGYINDMSKERLTQTLAEYKEICSAYPRAGMGVEVHCRDVGLEDPSITAKQHVSVAGSTVDSDYRSTSSDGASDDGSEGSQGKVKPGAFAQCPPDCDSCDDQGTYNEWIQRSQVQRSQAHDERLGNGALQLGDQPPQFDSDTIFRPTVEDYATQLTTPASADVSSIVTATAESEMFMPCMVGQLEGQFLKMFAQTAKAKAVLDVGTFTGYSALSFAEGLPADGRVVTIENDETIAAVAKAAFERSQQAAKIDLRVGDAPAIMGELLQAGEKFDIIFIDADKETYITYYGLAMDGLLADDGVILADNSLCALVYDSDDVRRQRLHEFNKMVADDERVEQTILTVREGITMIRKR
eukprot:COSAG01_NODE_1100_length_11694_cov_24.520138_1_plen_915_part_00